MARISKSALSESTILALAEKNGLSLDDAKKFLASLSEVTEEEKAKKAEEDLLKEEARKAQAIADKNELERLGLVAFGMPVEIPSFIKRFSVSEVEDKDKDGKVVGTIFRNVKIYFSNDSFSKELKAGIKAGTREEQIAAVEEAKISLFKDALSLGR